MFLGTEGLTSTEPPEPTRPEVSRAIQSSLPKAQMMAATAPKKTFRGIILEYSLRGKNVVSLVTMDHVEV